LVRAAGSTYCSRPVVSAFRAKPYGLDMTDDMLALVRENQREARAENVEFPKGGIEHNDAARAGRKCRTRTA
jgi:hypothetical protein